MAISHTQLRAFHAVAAEGSFTRASQRLHVTQPTLSGQVKELEERFDVRLFDRRNREIQLTELGEALFEITERQRGLEQEAEQLLFAARELVTGHIRVGADAPFHIIPLLAIFGHRYPGVNLSITFGNSENLRRELLARRTDIAVLPQIDEDEKLHVVPLQPDRLVVFVERGHAWSQRRSINLGELKQQRVILRELGSKTREVFEQALADAGIKLSEILEIGSREGVREAVAAGMGVGVVSERELGGDTRMHALPVRDATLQVPECVACLGERCQERIVKAFMEVIPEHVQQEP